ncbi:MAG: hypothetical protein KatS3mg105_2248 [Gemmatales bacterium]|nr:MAG: hypothetical protein KatS3mg105_2248 [Gemmatales bacterium]
MKLQLKSAKTFLTVGLFVLALAWTGLMNFVSNLAMGQAGAPPRDDGSVKASLSSLERDSKEFVISLTVDVRDAEDNVLTGLRESDFDVYENGKFVRQFKTFAPAGQGPVRIAMVVDASQSMAGRKIREAIRAAKELLLMLRFETDYAGLFFFNNQLQERNAEMKLPIGPMDKRRLVQAVDALNALQIGNGSPMLSTMIKGLEAMKDISGRRVMIVLTDGADTEFDEKEKNRQRVVRLCREMRIPLFMINTSDDREDEDFMKELCKETDGEYRHVDKIDKLKEIFVQIGEGLKNVYTIEYVSPNPVEDGTTRNVVVNVRNGAVGTQVRGEYSVPGALTAGGGARMSETGEGQSIGSLAIVFVCLAALLGALWATPHVLSRRAAAKKQTGTSQTSATAAAASPQPATATTARPKPPPGKRSAKLG